MEAKHKNALIGALLAVVFVMAVGYAAFAQQLTINGSATITSTWDVHFDTVSTSNVVANAAVTGQTPTGTVSLNDSHSATISADLKSPGDTVTFTLPIVNKGTIDASLSSVKATSTTNGAVVSGDGLTVTSQAGNIKYTVTKPSNSTLVASTGTDNVIVVAEYVNNAAGQSSAANESLAITVTIDYVQA